MILSSIGLSGSTRLFATRNCITRVNSHSRQSSPFPKTPIHTNPTIVSSFNFQKFYSQNAFYSRAFCNSAEKKSESPAISTEPQGASPPLPNSISSAPRNELLNKEEKVARPGRLRRFFKEYGRLGIGIYTGSLCYFGFRLNSSV